MKKIFLVVFILTACSTNPYHAYEKIELGTDKSILLDDVGSPLRKKHDGKKDIWTYKFYVDDLEVYRDVHLKDNKVIFKGETKNALQTQIEDKVEESLKKPLSEPPIDTDKYKKTDSKFVPIE